MQETDVQNILEGIKLLEKLSDGNLQQWKSTLEDVNSIWKRCPFKVGSLIKLNKTPEISKDSGWRGSKHFLVEGAIGKITERSFHNGLFMFYVTFDCETWIDADGNIHLVDMLANYCFSENWLTAANYDQLSCEAL
jgi:hypothetical protein